jgi:hypothetical protein
MPFFQGARSKLDYLARIHYTHLVVVDPSASACLYRTDSWEQNAKGTAGKVYVQWAPYYLDWLADVTRWAAPGVPGVDRVGNLLVVDITRARATSPDVESNAPLLGRTRHALR